MRRSKPEKIINRKSRNVVGQRIRLAREWHKPPITQDQLSGKLAAKNLTLDRVAITKLENGKRCVFDYEIPVIADVLKVDARWLLGIQTDGGPDQEERTPT